MNMNHSLGPNVSAMFLLGLTIISVGVFYLANGAREEIIQNQNYLANIDAKLGNE
jgi:hypothetical protein